MATPSSLPPLPPLAQEEIPGVVRDLQHAEVFHDLSDEDQRLIASCCQRCTFYRGAVIFEDSDPGNDLYVISRGRVTIRLESIQPHYEMVVASLGAGQVLGEMALLMEGPRSATAVCSEPTDALRIDGAALRALFAQRPLLGFHVVSNLGRILCKRLERMNRRLLGMMRINYY